MSYTYGPLSQSEESFEEKNPLNQPSAPSPRKDRLMRWAIGAILLCSIVDMACLAYLVVSPSFKSNGHHDDLPYRSTFTNLEKFYSNPSRKTTPRNPLNVLPRILVHIDSSRPDEVFPPWPKRYTTEGGMVPYDERHLRVTPQISTVGEFHVLDFGMEKCAVSIAPPTHNEHDKAHGKMGYGSYGRRQEPALLDVWLLDQSKSIEPSDLSYSTRPKQVKKLGTLTYSGDSVTRLEPFNCTSGEYYAVEVTCASGPCDVDIATTMYEPVGLIVQQLQTI